MPFHSSQRDRSIFFFVVVLLWLECGCAAGSRPPDRPQAPRGGRGALLPGPSATSGRATRETVEKQKNAPGAPAADGSKFIEVASLVAANNVTVALFAATLADYMSSSDAMKSSRSSLSGRGAAGLAAIAGAAPEDAAPAGAASVVGAPATGSA